MKSGEQRKESTRVRRNESQIVVMQPVTKKLFLKHQFLHFLFVFFFIFKIEHSAEDMIPYSGAYTKTLVLVLIMMKMMISPKPFHPFEWRIPCMNSVVHSAIHQVTKKKAGEKHESILTQDQKHDTENCRCKNKAWYRGHKETLLITGIMMMITVKYVGKLLHPRILTYQMK